jgi:hypothetical protein
MQAPTPTLIMPPSGLSGKASFAERAAGPISRPPGLLGIPAGELVLRICGGEHDGRVLRIQAAKCLIGSGTGCTLRLRARHIRPVHVLILRGPQGSVVRCWSSDVLLNERAFDEAALNAGDVLQIGPIQLHVSELNQFAPPTRSEARTPQSTLDQDALTQQLSRTIEQLQQELAAAAKRRSLEQQSAARQRQMIDEQLQLRLQSELDQQREQLQAQHERQLSELRGQIASQQKGAPSRDQQPSAIAVEHLQSELVATRDEKQTLLREIESLKLALQTRAGGEELARESATAQIEQLSRAFELVRQERDELFQRLQDEQQLFDEQATRWQKQIDDARTSAQSQISQGEAAAQKQLEIVRAELATRDAQLAEAHRQAREREGRLQDESRKQVVELLAQLTARNEVEEARRTSDSQRIAQLNATIDTLRSEAAANANTRQQQQDGFTQARKRLEAEITALTARLQQSDDALHEMRQNAGQIQAEVLLEAEQVRAERDAICEQMLRQQQEWTDFRSRLEIAATEERTVTAFKLEQLQAELAAAVAERDQLRSAPRMPQHVSEQEHSGRLAQMTISMKNLELDRGGSLAEIEQERNDWQAERDSLAQCIVELQQEISALKTNLADAEKQTRLSTVDSQSRAQAAEQQLELARAQVAEWQAAAEQAKGKADELSQAITRFRQQEQLWQLEREELDFSQQSSNERLRQLEASITELQQQLTQAQDSVASAPPASPRFANAPSGRENICSTINVNNQELAALQEQMSAPIPSLLASSGMVDSSELQARAAELQAQSEALEQQQTQLEEEQAIVARQRIELEQFHTSLLEFEQSLQLRAEQLTSAPAQLQSNAPEPEQDSYQTISYGGEIERESKMLSESEAFAVMADQVANLYRTPPPKPADRPSAPAAQEACDTPVADDPYAAQSEVSVPADYAVPAPEEEPESLVIPTSSPTIEFDPTRESNESAAERLDGITAPTAADDFDSQLDARIARVMGSENSSWNPANGLEQLSGESSASPGDSPASAEPPLSQSDAVNNVLDRLREAGLWKGEGTAKSDQFPSSDPPTDENAGLCRGSELGPVGHDESEAQKQAAPEVHQPEDGLDILARPQPANPSLLETPAEESEADDSIESYMSRLMQRLRSDSDDTPQDMRKSTGRGTVSAQARTAAVPAEPAPPPKPVDVTPITCLSELAPRSQAPEVSANLAAMRELANSAARGAIELHQQRSGQKVLNTRHINTLLALLAAAGQVFWWSRSGSWLALSGAGLCLTWAISSNLLARWKGSVQRKTNSAIGTALAKEKTAAGN